MRGYHSHDMVVPDFIVQSAGSSDGGWHDIVVGLGSDVEARRKSASIFNATRFSLLVLFTSEPISADRDSADNTPSEYEIWLINQSPLIGLSLSALRARKTAGNNAEPASYYALRKYLMCKRTNVQPID